MALRETKTARSIYIHIPFCKSKCHYCAFASVQFSQDLADKFVHAILREIDEKKEILKHTKVTSVYIGGGTPSVLAAGQIAQIVNEIKKWCDLDHCEFTIEVNPESVESDKLFVYKMLGVNRISIGMQSSNDEVLKESGRVHNNEQFLQAYKKIKKSGIKNINIDIMVGLPRSSNTNIRASIWQVIRLKPKHVSCYALMCESGTKLYDSVNSGQVTIMDDDRLATALFAAHKQLSTYGFKRYEISNFAKRGYESVHNKNYWNHGQYIGFGCGAVSFVDNDRFTNISTVKEYVAGNIKYEHDKITMDDFRKERIMLALRTSAGLPMDEIELNKMAFIKKLFENKLAVKKGGRLILTPTGLMISNEIISQLF